MIEQPVPNMTFATHRATGAQFAAVPGPEKNQVGALCWRTHPHGIQVLLITSRETGRWVIPKGGLIAGMDGPGSARQEAWEEAGVQGHLTGSEALGCFDYDKLNRKRQEAQRCRVQVFPLRVDRLVAEFPEKGERRRKWFAMGKAAVHVAEPELRGLLAALAEDPSPLTGAAQGPAPEGAPPTLDFPPVPATSARRP